MRGRMLTTKRRRRIGFCALDSIGLGCKFEQVLTEFVGVNATHGPLAGETARGYSRSAIACRCAWSGSKCDRTVHERDCAVDSDWSTGSNGFRGWPAEGGRDRCLLAGADSKEEITPAVEVLET